MERTQTIGNMKLNIRWIMLFARLVLMHNANGFCFDISFIGVGHRNWFSLSFPVSICTISCRTMFAKCLFVYIFFCIFLSLSRSSYIFINSQESLLAFCLIVTYTAEPLELFSVYQQSEHHK